jgi:hypothetical protein
VPLTSWAEIFAALNEPDKTPHWNNTSKHRDTIRKLNKMHNGPICFQPGKGKQPSVDKAALLAWWRGLSEYFDARSDEAAVEDESARASVANSHNYGRTGTVVPEIKGSVKRTRAKGNEQERKR